MVRLQKQQRKFSATAFPDFNKSTSPAKACPLPSKLLGGEPCETENHVLLRTSYLMPKAKQMTNASGNKTHHTYSKRESTGVTHNNMEMFPTTYSITSKLKVAKKDVGIAVTPDQFEPEGVKSTSRDSSSNVDKELSLLNSLERNH